MKFGKEFAAGVAIGALTVFWWLWCLAALAGGAG